MADKQLELVNGEFADLTDEVEAAKNEWLSATDPQRKVDLKDVYDHYKKMQELLMEDRRTLEAMLPCAGERTPLLPCQPHQH